MSKMDSIWKILPEKIRVKIQEENLADEGIQEIRIRSGKPLLVKWNGQEIAPENGNYKIAQKEVDETVHHAADYSLYAYQEEMRQGYLTIQGGHRVGMSGQVILEGEHIKNLRTVTSLNIRAAHEVLGCSDGVLPKLIQGNRVYSTLIISPPGCGKTTLLRDLIRNISNGGNYLTGKTVGVVDERSELGGSYLGIPQNNLGIRTDLLDSCPKTEGLMMLIRSMGPQMIAVDEIGSRSEIEAIRYAMYCGCGTLASVHGTSIGEIKKKPLFDIFFQENLFQRYVVLENGEKVGQIEGIYNSKGEKLC